MKTTLKLTLLITIVMMAFAACKKDKNEPAPENPNPPAEENEVITTVKLYLTDSATNVVMVKSFKDPDGDGGQPGGFENSGADSTFTLAPNHTYYGRVVILDETKTPVDSTSNEVQNESYIHMLFYNGNPAATGNSGNTILTPAPNYSVKLNGSDIVIRYLDLDNGPAHGYAQRNTGLKTRIRTYAATGAVKYPFVVTLRHQPGASEGLSDKDGTYTPGDTDVEVAYKVNVN